MNFRRIILSIFTVFFVLCGSILSFAQPNISKDEAKKTAENALKNYMGVELDDKFESRVEFRDEKYRDKSVWSMRWNKYKEDVDININAEIDSNSGKILALRYHNWSHNDYNRSMPSMTKEEAKKIADDFLKKINPVESSKVKLNDDNYMSQRFRGAPYYFEYVREENGIEFRGNNIEIQVNGNTGKVELYRLDWDYNVKFDDNKDLIDKEKAKQILKDNTDMKLVYSDIDKNDDNKPERIELYYKPYNEKGVLVDAKNGDMIRWDGAKNELKYKDIKDEEKEKIYKNSTKPQKHSTELTEKEARDRINSIVKNFVKGDFEVDFLRYEENDDYYMARGRKIWEAELDIKDKDRDGRVSIDALTGEIISFDTYIFRDEEDITPKITWSEGYDKAIDTLSKYYGYNIKDLDTKLVEQKGYYYSNGKKINTDSYYYTFARVNNKTQYENNSISIGVDAITGDIIEIEYEWDNDVKFPECKNIVDKDKSKEIYFDNSDIELGYTTIGNEEENNKQATLAYKLEDRYGFDKVDAITGKALDYNGDEFSKKDDKDYSDKLKDHWAKKELTILSDNHIIDLKEFESSKEISKIDAIKMVVNAKGYNTYRANDIKDLKFKDIKDNDEDLSYIKLAVEYEFVENKEENFNKDSNITREEMAKLIVKLIDKEEMAKMKGVYSLEFSDEASIDSNYKGYVAVCKGLGIINGGNSSFRPKDNATMTEMAVTIYNALSKSGIE
ncbi:YcdB/YcdC domain-containing protein [Tepidibacter hydrothermalis]|uniref:S-layer homology domain-containing protein n=1 Tax=Tepidibacter hydrothermalis TaxID=3036126 RepID=A0ABY8EFL5_9FIRM|nr:YcdB/YcdC domain-containing protein [Tepidibacter hydrothermalis]WFD10544.1 S-layer homology domain-containing protein [Tepidibacter hydrothermalis]